MSIRRWLPLLTIAALLVVVVVIANDASACPTCKDAVADNSPGGAQGATSGGDAAGGFNHAIYLALGTVFSIIGGLGWKVARAVSRSDAA
jgi:hypothetical protein